MADTMLEKVRKLLAKAEDPGCTPEEAAALNDKAAELIAKYLHPARRVELPRTSRDRTSHLSGQRLACVGCGSGGGNHPAHGHQAREGKHPAGTDLFGGFAKTTCRFHL